MKNADKPGYDSLGYKIQYRNGTPQEQRRQLGGYWNGYEDGNKVGLDRQVDKDGNETKKIGG